MPKIHFLNVRNGDCSIIQRDNCDRVTMIDICCGNIKIKKEASVTKAIAQDMALMETSVSGNFNMKASPTNPIEYLDKIGITSIHRFILTHPDMDHMDGIAELFDGFHVNNYWDCGVRRKKPDFASGQYLEEDWNLYINLINKQVKDTKVICPVANQKGEFWNKGTSDNDKHGDYLSILAPSPELISKANDGGDINDGSYVIVYHNTAGKIIFPGDSENATWEYILKNHEDKVKDATVLIAPHHGRDSGRNWDFLDVVKPKLTLIGNARNEHLNYKKYKDKSGFTITNNQAGNIMLTVEDSKYWVYVENKAYADCCRNSTLVNGMYKIGSI